MPPDVSLPGAFLLATLNHPIGAIDFTLDGVPDPCLASAGDATQREGSGTKLASASRKGTRTPREDLASRAKALHQAGHSYGQIAKIIGIPKSSIWDLVDDG